MILFKLFLLGCLSNPPLALNNLHYLLSAYSGGDLHAEILLGYAMQLLHEMPVLTRAAIRTAPTPRPWWARPCRLRCAPSPTLG